MRGLEVKGKRNYYLDPPFRDKKDFLPRFESLKTTLVEGGLYYTHLCEEEQIRDTRTRDLRDSNWPTQKHRSCERFVQEHKDQEVENANNFLS